RKLAELAEQQGDAVEAVREEFEEYRDLWDEAPAALASVEETEPWPEPIDVQALLSDVMGKIRKYVVMRDEQAVVCALFSALTWVHADAARHSPILAVSFPDPDAGKTTLLGVFKFLVFRTLAVVEMTGPSLYRITDRSHPTLIVDQADTLFARKSD